ncbi:acyl carrier protein [Bordetella sp. BOR01]|uniref:acyl carrier protein n=1 Tax=Bordetella sp. BOR01 TaxID=2854779 RepID=UPI001C47BBBC|nr:acyl carrier protein [Bordetella sp. BOR01]MBV7483491.1 acyl carrier protein [Bordetella sp. BOR01]
MQTLPDTPILREQLATIIARTCRCESASLLQDQEFAEVITQFDSLAILEILLEIETEFGLTTDEMLPTNHEMGAQEVMSVFPGNLSALIVYMHEVMARRALPLNQDAGAAQ